MELNLDRFPTKAAMLAVLRTWLRAAEQERITDRRPAYVFALRDAIEAVEETAHPVQAIAALRDLQAARIRIVALFTKRTRIPA
jgi:hypothetical protein